MPEAVRSRAAATNNMWRSKLKLSLKGQHTGSTIPYQIQRELDLLIMEMTSGMSDVSERKEIVDVESIAPRHAAG